MLWKQGRASMANHYFCLWQHSCPEIAMIHSRPRCETLLWWYPKQGTTILWRHNITGGMWQNNVYSTSRVSVLQVILPNKRHRNSLMDLICTAPNQLFVHLAFWRQNQFGRNKNHFYYCGQLFTQSHMQSCTGSFANTDVQQAVRYQNFTVLDNLFQLWWDYLSTKP